MSVIRIVATADAKKGDTVSMLAGRERHFLWDEIGFLKRILYIPAGSGYTLNEDGEVVLNI